MFVGGNALEGLQHVGRRFLGTVSRSMLRLSQHAIRDSIHGQGPLLDEGQGSEDASIVIASTDAHGGFAFFAVGGRLFSI
jgi:hypothetical protein